VAVLPGFTLKPFTVYLCNAPQCHFYTSKKRYKPTLDSVKAVLKLKQSSSCMQIVALKFIGISNGESQAYDKRDSASGGRNEGTTRICKKAERKMREWQLSFLTADISYWGP
jgi:hypothetical protein